MDSTYRELDWKFRLALLEAEFSALEEHLSNSCGCGCPASLGTVTNHMDESKEMLQNHIDGKLQNLGFRERLVKLEKIAQELKCSEHPERIRELYIERLKSLIKLDVKSKEILQREIDSHKVNYV